MYIQFVFKRINKYLKYKANKNGEGILIHNYWTPYIARFQ